MLHALAAAAAGVSLFFGGHPVPPPPQTAFGTSTPQDASSTINHGIGRPVPPPGWGNGTSTRPWMQGSTTPGMMHGYGQASSTWMASGTPMHPGDRGPGMRMGSTTASGTPPFMRGDHDASSTGATTTPQRPPAQQIWNFISGFFNSASTSGSITASTSGATNPPPGFLKSLLNFFGGK